MQTYSILLTLKEGIKKNTAAIPHLLEYIYTDDVSTVTEELLRLATAYDIPRLAAICNIKLNIKNENLLLEFPSTFNQDFKAAYVTNDNIQAFATEEWVEIICNEKPSIKVLKRVLMSADYFKSMLQSGMQEATKSQIVLPEFSRKILEYVVSYLVSGTIESEDGNEIMEILVVANQMCMTDLIKLCEFHLASQLETENIQVLREFAEKYNAQRLLEACKDFNRQKVHD